MTPGTHGHNLYLKVGDMKQVLEKKRPDGSTLVIHEALVGDSTGCILLTLRNGESFNATLLHLYVTLNEVH